MHSAWGISLEMKRCILVIKGISFEREGNSLLNLKVTNKSRKTTPQDLCLSQAYVGKQST